MRFERPQSERHITNLEQVCKAFQLGCVRNKVEEIIRFMGVADQHLEVLFIPPTERGNGIVIGLFTSSINEFNVNEENDKAVHFYKQCGFITLGRSELDSSGNPFQFFTWN